MRLPRFSIAGLLAFVLVCGLGLGALKAASGMWASVMVTVAAVALLTSIVGAAKGRYRAGWLGFAVFAWGYVALNFTAGCQQVIQPHLLTSLAIVESFRYVHPNPMNLYVVEIEAPGQLPAHQDSPKAQTLRHPDPEYLAVPGVGPARIYYQTAGQALVEFGPGNFSAYYISGHALMTILVGALGWVIAGLVADRRAEGER